MDPVPYEIRDDDVDEVINAHGGGEWPEDARREARSHVMKNIVELDDIVRTAPEDPAREVQGVTSRAGPIGDHPGDRAPDRREMALAAIEDLLIRDGFIDVDRDESRVYPVAREDHAEADDA